MDRCVAVCRWSGHVLLSWSECESGLAPSNKKQPAREAEADFRRALFRLHLPLKGCVTCVRPPLSLVPELSPELCCVFPDTSPTIQVRCP